MLFRFPKHCFESFLLPLLYAAFILPFHSLWYLGPAWDFLVTEAAFQMLTPSLPGDVPPLWLLPLPRLEEKRKRKVEQKRFPIMSWFPMCASQCSQINSQEHHKMSSSTANCCHLDFMRYCTIFIESCENCANSFTIPRWWHLREPERQMLLS